MASGEDGRQVVVRNKKARRDYEVLDTWEAGLVLQGSEVKSIRDGKVNISDAYARVDKEQVFLYGCDIQPCQTAGEYFQHTPRRPRRLLHHGPSHTAPVGSPWPRRSGCCWS